MFNTYSKTIVNYYPLLCNVLNEEHFTIWFVFLFSLRIKPHFDVRLILFIFLRSEKMPPKKVAHKSDFGDVKLASQQQQQQDADM